MNLTIHKTTFAGASLYLPRGAYSVVHVAQQHPTDELPTVWYEIDTDLGTKLGDGYRLLLVGTGHLLPTVDDLNNGLRSALSSSTIAALGSAVCGSFVWHVYGTKRLLLR